MKKILLIILLSVFAIFTAQASHLMGADISYQYLFSDASGDYYQVTLTLYRDCSGITVSTSQTLRMNSGSGCGTAFTQTLPLVGTGTEVSPLCPSEIANSTCNGGTIIGVEQYVFQDVVLIPTECDDWNLSWYQCCRNDGGATPPPHNLVSPASYDLYVDAQLDNTAGLNNSSPQFTSLPVPYICANQPFTYNHGAFDSDGDSLVYTLVPAQDGPWPGTDLTYNAPASATNPIAGTPNVFDSNTGSIYVNPDGSDELAVMAVLVEEYRNGVLIGSTMRDLQVVVQACANIQPTDDGANGGFDNVVGDGAIVDSNSIEVCPNGYVEFEVDYSDPNGDNVTLTSNIGTVIPGASFTQSGMGSYVTGTFTWTPTAADVGFHNFTVTVQDDGCPILGSQVYAFDVEVLTRTFTEPDQAYCNSGGPIDISASGGSVFNWTVISGDGTSMSCTNCQTTSVDPSSTTTYEVTSDLSGTCKNKDTVTITKVNDIALAMSADPTICKYGSASISTTPSPGGEGPFTYNWSGTDLSSTTVSNPTASPLTTTTYPVIVESAAGCRMIDSVTVTVSGVAPNLIAYASSDSLCQGETADLTSAITPDVCEVTTTACSGANQTLQFGAGISSSSTYGPFYHSASGYSNRKQYIFKASELQAMGFTTGGRINSLSLNINSDGSNMSDLQISMGCTSLDQFPDANFINGLSVVRNAANYNPGPGWNTFVFDNPYMWDGVSNLIVEFCTDVSHSLTSSTVYYTSTTSTFYSVIYSNFLGAGACSDPNGVRTYYRPDMQFDVCEAIPAGITYSWSPSGGSSDAATVSPASTTTYTLTASDAGCDGTADVLVSVSPAIVPNASADASICYGDNTNLSVNPSGSSGYTYQWSPSATVSSPTSATTTATPTGTTKYYVDINAGFCTVRDSITINVGGGPMTAIASKDTICPNESVQLNAAVGGGCFDESVVTTSTIGVNNTLTFSSTPSGSISGGTLEICGYGDLDLTSEYWTINDENGNLLWDFAEGTGEGTQCGVAFCETFALTNAQIDGWAADGSISFEAVASTANNVPYCSSPTDSVWMRLQYCTPSGTYDYVWDNTSTLSDGSVDNPLATPTQTTTYNVTATDPLAPTCPSNATVTVAIDSSVYVAATADKTFACNGEAVNLGSSVTGTPLPGAFSVCGTNGSSTSTGTVYTIGTGTGTSTTTSPFYNWSYTGKRMQTLFHASDLQAMGMTSGAIDAISLYIGTKWSTTSFRNFTVKMGCTSETALSTATGWLPTATVRNAADYTTTGNSWNNIILDNVFDWDGTSNIVVEMCFDENTTDDYDYVQYSSPGYTATMYYYSSTGSGCSLAATYTSSYRQNMRFRVHPPPPNPFTYSWTPTTGLSDATSPNPTYTADGSATTYLVTVSGGLCDVVDTVTVDGCTLGSDEINLSGTQDGLYNVLNWESVLENVDYYIIERSAQGSGFVAIGERAGKGKKFEFIDTDPSKEVNYYRVIAITSDGEEIYSNTITIDFVDDNVNVYPNPTNSAKSLFITYETEADDVTVEIVDLLGKQVVSDMSITQKIPGKVELDISHLPVGSYIYRVHIDGRASMGKLVLTD